MARQAGRRGSHARRRRACRCTAPAAPPPRPRRRPARGWCAVIAARGDRGPRPAWQALASVVGWPYLPEVDQRQVHEIAGRHAVARPQRPVGVGQQQVGVVQHVGRRERPGSDGQDGEARIEDAASHLLEQQAVVGPLARLEREVRSDPDRWPTIRGRRRTAALWKNPRRRALEDRVGVRARCHEAGSDLVDMLQEAQAGRRNGNLPGGRRAARQAVGPRAAQGSPPAR